MILIFMTKENKEDSKKEVKETERGSGVLAVIVIICLAIGFGAGYLLHAPGINTDTGAGGNGTETFTPNAAKASEIETLVEDLMYVQTNGMEVDATVSVEKKEILVFNIQSSVGNFAWYIDTNYENILGIAQEQNIAELKADVESAKDEMAPQEMEKSEVPDVSLHVMAFCPFGNEAEDGIKDALVLLADKINFEPVYIISKTSSGYSSLHGVGELNQGIREKIVFNIYGAEKWIEYVYAVNAECTKDTVETCWKSPATEMGLNTSQIEEEFNTNFNTIADGEIANAQGATSSPTLLVNGIKYSGQRTAEAYKTGMCSAFTTEPTECDETLSSDGSAVSGNC